MIRLYHLHVINLLGNSRPASIIFLMILYFQFAVTSGQVEPTSYINRLSKEIRNTGNDSLKIELLSNIASFYFNYLDDNILADSVSEVAIRIAENSFRHTLQFQAYTKYIQSNDLERFQEKDLIYAKKTFELAATMHNPMYDWRFLKNMDTVYLSRLEFGMAYSYSMEALTVANKIKNDSLIIESYLDLGRSLDGRKEKLEALKTYIKATDLAKERKSPVLLKKCYHILSDFYRMVGLLNKAISFNDSESYLVLKTHPVDSMELMWIQYNRVIIDINNENNNNQRMENDMHCILDFAMRHNTPRLKKFGFAMYRTHLLKANLMDQLYDLYKKKYPTELQQLAFTDPAMLFRLKAIIADKENKTDSATIYFRKAEQLMLNQYPSRKSQFYYRYAQFLIRHGRTMEAIEMLHKSYNLAEKAGFQDNMISASELLNSLYLQLGDYQNAYVYLLQTKKLADSIHEWSNKELLFRTQIEHDDQQREMAAALTKEKSEKEIKQKKTERNMMAAGVGFLIILSFAIYRNFRTQKKSNKLLDAAKKQSDDLLLNILPYETAEELKLTGTAKAKRFDEVTVMFTDFKGFTQLSEKLGAEDLVKMIDFYFSEFDKIIGRHNLEKIKIIGDSYMCAGGIPIINKTHAVDIVSAALEMMEFMEIQKKERISRGKLYFELRIGINSGPVVAGIVGLKKFAYDIWGDSVNIASRMESGGEAGKVNVSGFTYELIKDRFDCTYRGKIEAKNKGMIDMYFVNGE